MYTRTNNSYYSPKAIDLSNLNKGPKQQNKKLGSNRKDKSLLTCYRCSKTGYFTRDCCLKNKVVRQLNILTYNNPNNAKQEVVTYSVG